MIQIRAACDISRAKRIWWSKIFEILIVGETFSQLEHKPALYKLEGKLSRSLKLSLQQPPANTAAGGDAQISSIPPFVAMGRSRRKKHAAVSYSNTEM